MAKSVGEERACTSLSTLSQGAQVQLVDKTVGVEHPVELRLVNPKPGDDNDAMVLTLLQGA